MALTWNGGCGQGGGAILYPEMGQNTNGAMTQKATTDTFHNYDNVVVKTLTVAGWVLNGTVYEQTIALNHIYSMKPIINACGAATGQLASDEQYAAFRNIKVIGDTEAATLTFYDDSVPVVDINISIKGVD